MEKLSVVIISFNEENNIGRCIDSVKDVADEVIVLDSYSTDRTVAVSESRGAIVRHQAFLGYIEQNNLAVSMASNEYILNLDADEALHPVLADSIRKAKENFTSKAYKMNRCTNYCGKYIRHGSWYPDTKLRLYDRKIAEWGGLNPHNRLVLREEVEVAHLKGDILHYSYNSISEHVAQNNRFSTISAESLYSRGKKPSLFKILVNPIWAFVLSYLLRAGFLDGIYGFVIAIQIAHLTFLKYAKLYQLHKSSK